MVWLHHDRQVAGKWERHQTQDLKLRDCIWDQWSKCVARYVGGCGICEKTKADRHSIQTKLVLMSIEEHSFAEIVMHFVRELTESEAYNTILVILDQVTKVQHYIPAKTTSTVEDLADSYV